MDTLSETEKAVGKEYFELAQETENLVSFAYDAVREKQPFANDIVFIEPQTITD
jgi:hypothetical protein